MKRRILISAILLILSILVIIFLSSIYTVREDEQAVVTRFGKIVSTVTTPGLKFKQPIIQKVIILPKKKLEWDGNPGQKSTKDKRFIWVDTFARWIISDPVLYYKRLEGKETIAQSRLDDILDGATRSVIAEHNLIELVQKKGEHIEGLPEAKYGRAYLAHEVLKLAQNKARNLGIEISDFEFKRINYVDEVRKAIYARMISERKKIAEKFLSEGEGEAAKIAGLRLKKKKTIISEAYRKSEEIKGKADKKAAEIYAKSYLENPEFYEFYKKLEIYSQSLQNNTRFISTTDSYLFDLLKKLPK